MPRLKVTVGTVGMESRFEVDGKPINQAKGMTINVDPESLTTVTVEFYLMEGDEIIHAPVGAPPDPDADFVAGRTVSLDDIA